MNDENWDNFEESIMSGGDCEYPVKDKPPVSGRRETELLPQYDESRFLQFFNSKSEEKLITPNGGVGTNIVEYQEMVEIAENKCTRLKDKLERLKEIYNKQNDELEKKTSTSFVRQTQSVQIEGPKQKIDFVDLFEDVAAGKDSPELVRVDVNVPLHLNKMKNNMIRQKSKQISTDTTGGALGTISSILSGISESFGQGPSSVRRNPQELEMIKEEPTKSEKSLNELLNEIQGVEELLKQNKDDELESNFKTTKPKTKKGKGKSKKLKKTPSKFSQNASQITLKGKDNRKLKKAYKSDIMINRNKSMPFLHNKTTTTTTTKKPVKRVKQQKFDVSKRLLGGKRLTRQGSSKDLVEIFHNNSIKESNSSDVHVPRKDPEHDHLPKIKVEKKFRPSRLYTNTNRRGDYLANTTTTTTNTATSIIHHYHHPPKPTTTCTTIVPPLDLKETPCTSEEYQSFGAPTVMRNYEMPTIASQLKRAAKFYIERYVRTIPFCPVKSLGPSHNIGIKIQQILNMLKTQQPAENINLAYRIGLAAEKLNNKHLSTLATTLTSKIRHPNENEECPLAVDINYQRLKEMAKAIPEESIEDIAAAEADEPPPLLTSLTKQPSNESLQSLIITGPSGDVKIHNPKTPSWTDNGDNKNCTCLVKEGVDFQLINKKYGPRYNSSTTTRTPLAKNKFKLTRPPARNISKNNITKKVSIKEIDKNNSNNNNKQQQQQQQMMLSPTATNEQKLKEVLQKLHDEFYNINKQNDYLIEKVNNGDADENLLKEIRSLEKELTNKEEEIAMVVSLYKEVMALKNQMKNLKQKASKEIVTKKSQKFNKNSTATHLTKLLRQIQHYQVHYKKNAN